MSVTAHRYIRTGVPRGTALSPWTMSLPRRRGYPVHWVPVWGDHSRSAGAAALCRHREAHHRRRRQVDEHAAQVLELGGVDVVLGGRLQTAGGAPQGVAALSVHVGSQSAGAHGGSLSLSPPPSPVSHRQPPAGQLESDSKQLVTNTQHLWTAHSGEPDNETRLCGQARNN